MRATAKKLLVLAAGLVISAVCLGVFVSRLARNWSDVVDTFRRTDWLCLVPALALIGLLYCFRVTRWRLFLRPIKRVRPINATSATCIGFMTNSLLPARVGEIIRPYVLHRKEGVAFGHALATVGLARVFDLIGLSILLLITWVMLSAYAWQAPPGPQASGAPEALAQIPQAVVSNEGLPEQEGAAEDGGGVSIQSVWRAGIVGVLIALFAVSVLVGLALFPHPFLKLGEACSRILPVSWREPANAFLRSVADAMGFLKNWRGVALAVAYSTGVWLSQGVSTYVLARGMDIELDLAGAFLVTLAVSAAIALPQAPGYVGVFPLAAALVVGGLRAAGKGEAEAFALLVWLVNVVPISLVGLGFLWYEGLSLGRLAAASRELKDTGAPER